MADLPMVPVALLVAGGYLTWYGVHYWREGGWPTSPVKSVLTGKGVPAPGRATTSAAILTADIKASSATDTGGTGGGTGQATGTAGATGSAIADAALKYSGQGYVFGGNADRPGNWDCSSFVSYVLGHDLNMKLPGGRWGDPGFPPHVHGPTTLNYLVFGQPVTLQNIAPGDLIVSTEHMGICIGGGKMISAQDPRDGTGIAGFPGGFPAGPPVYRRVT